MRQTKISYDGNQFIRIHHYVIYHARDFFESLWCTPYFCFGP